MLKFHRQLVKNLVANFQNGHNFLKNDPNWAYEVFYDIYQKFKCQKTPQMSNLDHIRVSYGHLKVENRGKYRLVVDTIRFRVDCKKSRIGPKVHI